MENVTAKEIRDRINRKYYIIKNNWIEQAIMSTFFLFTMIILSIQLFRFVISDVCGILLIELLNRLD